jgi:hypothetical protein
MLGQKRSFGNSLFSLHPYRYNKNKWPEEFLLIIWGSFPHFSIYLYTYLFISIYPAIYQSIYHLFNLSIYLSLCFSTDEPKALHMLGKCSIPELYPQPLLPLNECLRVRHVASNSGTKELIVAVTGTTLVMVPNCDNSHCPAFYQRSMGLHSSVSVGKSLTT